MGRKKTTAEKIAAAGARAALAASESGEIELEGDGEHDIEMEAMRSLAALGDGNEITYRLSCVFPPANRGRLDDVDRDDLINLVEILRDRYGPGKYVVTAVDGSGQFVRGGRRTVTISPLVGGARSAVTGAPGGGGSYFNLQEWMARQDRIDEKRRLEAREDRKDLLALAGIVLPALLGRGQGQSLSDLTTALKDMREMSGAGGGGSLDTFIKGLELGKDMGGNSESIPGVIASVVKDLAGSPRTQQVLDAIAQRKALPKGNGAAAPPPTVPYQGPQAAIPAPPPVVPAAGAAGPGKIPAAPQGVPEMLWAQTLVPLLQRLARELHEFAQNGADPGICAEAMVGKTPRHLRALVTVEQLKTWLTNPNWWALLIEFKPELEPYQGYCDDVRLVLIRLLTEPETEPEQP